MSSDFFPLLGSTIILVFLYMYELGQISDGDRPKWGVEYRWDIKNRDFRLTYRYISETIENMHVVTVEN